MDVWLGAKFKSNVTSIICFPTERQGHTGTPQNGLLVCGVYVRNKV